MKRSDVLKWAQKGADGQMAFRAQFADITDFNLSLQVVINGKRIESAADEITTTLSNMEGKEIKALREKAGKASEPARSAIASEFNQVYGKFWTSPETQAFLLDEADNLELKIIDLDEKAIKRSGIKTPAQVEALMLFTNIDKIN